MNILVAGGSGFIGSFLIDSLLEAGNHVVCVDNLSTGHKQNIEHHLGNKNFEFIEADILSDWNYEGKLDQIYHLASPASPNAKSDRSYIAMPFETMGVNTTGTWKLCELALKNKAPLLFASTSEAYGDPLVHPQVESYRGNVSTTGPRAVYDEAKRFGETIVSAYTHYKGMDGKIIRIFNTYGPRMDLDEGRVVYTLIRAALRNEPIPIYGDGQQTRSFCFVTDLVSGMTKVMNNSSTKGEVINLGNPGEFTILELAQKIIAQTNSKSTLEFFPLPTDDPMKRKPDISKAKKLLNWEPKVSLDDGLKEAITYVKKVIKI